MTMFVHRVIVKRCRNTTCRPVCTVDSVDKVFTNEISSFGNYALHSRVENFYSRVSWLRYGN